MTNHPNRSSASFRFVAFSTITGQSLAHAATAADALHLGQAGLPDADFLEVLDCGDNGRKVWTGGVEPHNPVLLSVARQRHQAVYRGAGYADSANPLPAIPLAST